jgi:predicted nucleotidyltransferase
MWYNLVMKKRYDSCINRFKTYFQKKAKTLSLEAVFLFGSFAHGFEKTASDIDIAIVFSNDKKRGDIFQVLTNLSHELSILSSKNVDVIWIDKDFSKPMLFYNAIVHGVPLFISDKEKYISLILRAIEEMEDFSIFGREWQIETAEKILEKIG